MNEFERTKRFLQLSERARRQLKTILDSVRSEFSEDVYLRVRREIFDVFARIERFPESGQMVSEPEAIRRTTVAKANSVYWVVNEREVLVLAITRRGQNFTIREVRGR